MLDTTGIFGDNETATHQDGAFVQRGCHMKNENSKGVIRIDNHVLRWSLASLRAVACLLCLLPTLARAQNPGVEFTVFPTNQGNGQMWVAGIEGISADGNTAALFTINASSRVAWWRRGQGIIQVPASVFATNGVPWPATGVKNITSDGENLVGVFSETLTSPSSVYFYSDTQGMRSIGRPKSNTRPGYYPPGVRRVFAPTTDRVVVFYEEREPTPNTPPLGDVRVWTPSTNTWLPLFTPPVAGSFVRVVDMSDNGISIGDLWTGGVEGIGTGYSWVHHPVNGVTLYGPTSPIRYLTSISSDGNIITLNPGTTMTLLVNGTLQSFSPPNCQTSVAWDTADNADVVMGTCGVQLGSVRRGQPFVTDLNLLLGLGVPLTSTQQQYVALTSLSGDGSVRLGVAGESRLCILKVSTPQCNPIDFNNDGLFPTDEDVIDFLTVLAGGTCSNAPNCFGIDFNNDGLFPSDDDLIAFFRVFAGGDC